MRKCAYCKHFSEYRLIEDSIWYSYCKHTNKKITENDCCNAFETIFKDRFIYLEDLFR